MKFASVGLAFYDLSVRGVGEPAAFTIFASPTATLHSRLQITDDPTVLVPAPARPR